MSADDLDDLGTKSCPSCGSPMEPAGDERFAFWWCSDCGNVDHELRKDMQAIAISSGFWAVRIAGTDAHLGTVVPADDGHWAALRSYSLRTEGGEFVAQAAPPDVLGTAPTVEQAMEFFRPEATEL